jgi:hypothetical protein
VSQILIMKRNDTAPVLRRQLVDGNGDPADLTGAEVLFNMRPSRKGLELVIDGVACSIDVDPTTGFATYEWVPADTETAGRYLAEFQVTFVNEKVETFPNDSYIRIKIVEDLGP